MLRLKAALCSVLSREIRGVLKSIYGEHRLGQGLGLCVLGFALSGARVKDTLSLGVRPGPNPKT